MARKARLKKLLPKTPPDPKEAMTIRVAHRICAIVYGGEEGCVCQRQGLGRCCDNPKSAAQHAMDEILK
jgi:hypothetical protein